MSETLALYAGAIMANKIVNCGKITERYDEVNETFDNVLRPFGINREGVTKFT